ncbi:MAG: Universal stress protein UspA [Myxococcaceae bacterium]|nr:Universal stress protein UspA [Myxococcaceae bacterium]
MNLETSPRSVFLVAVDDSPASLRAAATAARFMMLPGSEVHMLHVVPRLEGMGAAIAIDEARHLLERTCEASGMGKTPTLHINAGVPWREIVQLAANLHADAIILGTHDRGSIARMLLGSVTEEVMRKAGCPVYVARAKDHVAASPEIEPPCTACLATQRQSNGKTLWCERHTRRHAHGRLHYQIPSAFEVGSNLIRV